MQMIRTHAQKHALKILLRYLSRFQRVFFVLFEVFVLQCSLLTPSESTDATSSLFFLAENRFIFCITTLLFTKF